MINGYTMIQCWKMNSAQKKPAISIRSILVPLLTWPDIECHANLLKSEGALNSRLQWADDPDVDSALQLPPFQLNDEEQQRLGEIENEVFTYCDEMVLEIHHRRRAS